MSTISIKDLPESVDLDHQAMLAIIGGTRFGGRPNLPLRAMASAVRVIDFPPGLPTYVAPAAGGLPAGSKLRK